MVELGELRLRVSLIVLAVILTPISLASAQNTKDDTNTSSTASSVITTVDPDVRLHQKVTYEASSKSVKDILEDLSQQTKVVLNAGNGKQNWQVRDRKMIIFARDVPLAQLMNSIARVMKFNWVMNEKVSPPTYRLVVDRQLIAKMQADQWRKDQELEGEVGRGRQRFVDAVDKVSKMSDADIETLAQQDPYLYLLGKTGCARLTAALFQGIPGLLDNFLNSARNVLLPVSQLSPSEKQLLLAAIMGNWSYRQFQEGTNKPFPDGLADALGRLSIGVEHLPRPLQQWGDGSEQLAFYGGLGMGSPFGFCHIGYWRDPDSPVSQRASEYLLNGENDERPSKEALDKLEQEEATAWRKEREKFEKYSLIEPRIEHADEPYLHNKIRLKKPVPVKQTGEDTTRLQTQVLAHATCLQSIAEASGFCVVSDSFNRVLPNSGLGEEEQEMKDILNTFARNYNCNWEKHGSALEFRDRDWFRKRSSQIPDQWVDMWADSLKKHGVLSLEEFAQICVLDFSQIEENINTDPILRKCTDPIWNLIDNKTLLCLYLRLDHNQQRTLFSKGGLDSGTLRPEQYQYLIGVFDYGNAIQGDVGRLLSTAERGLILKAEPLTEKDGLVSGYQFLAIIDDGKPPFKWKVTLPSYKPAKESLTPVKK